MPARDGMPTSPVTTSEFVHSVQAIIPCGPRQSPRTLQSLHGLGLGAVGVVARLEIFGQFVHRNAGGRHTPQLTQPNAAVGHHRRRVRCPRIWMTHGPARKAGALVRRDTELPPKYKYTLYY